MRKCFSFALVSAALAAMTVVSCTKEFFEEPLPEDGGETREVVFDLDSDLTKTAISQNGDKLSINWINTSNSSVHIFENGKEGTNEKIIVSKTGSAAISVNFSGLGLSLFGGFNYNGIIADNFYLVGIITGLNFLAGNPINLGSVGQSIEDYLCPCIGNHFLRLVNENLNVRI